MRKEDVSLIGSDSVAPGLSEITRPCSLKLHLPSRGDKPLKTFRNSYQHSTTHHHFSLIVSTITQLILCNLASLTETVTNTMTETMKLTETVTETVTMKRLVHSCCQKHFFGSRSLSTTNSMLSPRREPLSGGSSPSGINNNVIKNNNNSRSSLSDSSSNYSLGTLA